jgi:hypothetical protein
MAGAHCLGPDDPSLFETKRDALHLPRRSNPFDSNLASLACLEARARMEPAFSTFPNPDVRFTNGAKCAIIRPPRTDCNGFLFYLVPWSHTGS